MPHQGNNRTRQRQRQRQRSHTPYERPLSPALPREITPIDEPHELDKERSPLPTDGRQLTRMVALSWTPRLLVNMSTKLRQARADGSEQAVRDGASKIEKLYIALYDKLDRLQPDLFDMLANRDGHFVRNIRDKLGDGRNGAKAEDNHKAKHALPHLRHWQPPLKDEPKSSRGTFHPECAFFLSPITVDMEDAEQRRQFVECANPPMVAKHWGRFLYPDGKGNSDRPSEGLCKSQLLVDMANVILRSPSSVIPTARVRPNVVRRGPKGIAVKYKLTQTRYALSSEESWSDDGGTFNYIQFYNQLREYLEAPRFHNRAKALLDWWNKKLFPDVIQDGGDSDDNDDGMLALLDAELEGEEAADADKD